MATKKALVLSGGGGRGAYHIGVIETLIKRGWMQDGVGPDIIAGTSIGAINAAALASGMTIAELKQRWLAMHTEDVHRLSNDLPPLSRPVMHWLMRGILTSEEHGGDTQIDMPADIGRPGFLQRLRDVFKARPFRSLLDTTPWRHTLGPWMNFERINSPQSPTLLLTATDLQRGTLKVFCNHTPDGTPVDRINADHLMASSSIPAVYPWTKVDSALYWDGAVLANTPLGPVIELAQGDIEIVVVMMTPWDADPDDLQEQLADIPQDLVQALWLTLDWALLASYRASFKLLRLYNHMAEMGQKLEAAAELTGDTSLRWPTTLPHRVAEPCVVSPQHLLPLDWIVDYEAANHQYLFELGAADAERCLAAL